jgi:hypothetical protein
MEDERMGIPVLTTGSESDREAIKCMQRNGS